MTIKNMKDTVASRAAQQEIGLTLTQGMSRQAISATLRQKLLEVRFAKGLDKDFNEPGGIPIQIAQQ